MSYIASLSSTQKANIKVLVDELQKAGITNPISIAGMLAIISKESGFVPQDENMNYSAKRLQEVFGISSSKANQLANNPQAIANYVYGQKPSGMRDNAYGNTSYGDGWKYRGRGLNGITFKGNYKKYADLIGVDIVSKPERANDIATASKIQIEYAKSNMKALAKSGKLASYNSTGINDFKDLKNSVMAFYHINAGVGNSVSKIKGLAVSDSLGGMKKALSRVDELFDYTKTLMQQKPSGGSKGGFGTSILLAILFVSGWIAYRKYYNLPI
jgi:predicted chitinase